jgi:hypothetical protein
MPNIAGRQIPTLDAVVIGAGVAMLIDSVLPWYHVSFAGASDSRSAWGSGLLAILPVLLIIAVAAAVAGRIFAGFTLPKNPQAGPALTLLAVSGLATLLLLLKLAFDGHVGPLDLYDRSFGLFLGFVISALQTGALFLAFKASGEKLPEFGNKGTSSGQPPAAPPAV